VTGLVWGLVVEFGLRVGLVEREILRYAWRTAALRMTKS